MARKDAQGSKTKVRGSAPTPTDPAWMAVVERRGFWIALGGLALMLILFFNPVFFGGKIFQPPDQVASMAHRPYVSEAFHSEGSLLERYPLWTPYIFSGMPSFGSLIAAPYTNPMSLLLTPIPGVFKVVTYYLLLGIFCWMFLRRQSIGTLPALFGATAYVFSAHIITLIMFGHNSKIATLVFLPLVLLATDSLWGKPSLRWVSLLALAIGTMLVTSHLQIAYYTLLAAGLYLVVTTVSSMRGGMGVMDVVKRWGLWGVGLVVGLMASAVLFMPVREYAKYSIRGGTGGGLPYEYATNWSFSPVEIATFFVPSFMGFGGETYWGWMPFTDFPHYMGILVLLLAVLTLVLWPRQRMHVYLASLAGVSLILAFGKHVPLLYNFMFEYFPHFNKFRVPSMILVLFQISVAMLAALGLGRMLAAAASERARLWKATWMTGAVVGGLVVLLGGMVASGGMNGMLASRLGERAPVYGATPQQMATFVPRVTQMVGTDLVIVVLILGIGLMLFWAFFKGKIAPWMLPAGLLILTCVDLWRVDARPQEQTLHNRTAQGDVFAVTPAVQFMQQDQEPFRILPLTGAGRNNNMFAYFKLPSILGYHPAKLKIYQDLIDDEGPVGISKSLSQGNFNVVSMLNMKYIVADQDLQVGPFRTVHRSNQFVMENADVLPRMWFVDRSRVVADEAQHLLAVGDPAWRPAEEALLFEPVSASDPGTGGTATLTFSSPRELHADLNSPGNSLLVVSEVFFEAGWKAWIDDQPVDIHRANYVLRAVEVPPGQHTLRMRFDPSSFRNGALLSVSAYALILLGIVVSVVTDRRRRAVA